MLLILTSDQDLTADYLIVELIRRQLPYFRLNAEELPEAEFTFSLSGARTVRNISVGPKTLDLGAVEAVWYRRSINPIPKAALTPPERHFVSGELRHLVMGLVLNPRIAWVNPVDKVSVAEHKLYQLQVATNLGLQVPRTLVSGDVEKLRSFASGNAGGTICKPIFHGMFFDGSSRHSVYTRRLDVETLDSASVSACPVLLQEEIPRIADVRATFIGRHCFVADIRGDASLIDWRDPGMTVDYTVSSLDDTTAELCRRMLAELGLVYGAFDFVRTPSGDLVFLEVNPTGEWAWLEDRLGFSMRDAFVESLYGVCN
jgi:glutathione synthase/RimK-type ligase-like ATP-grasp enzyme